MSQDNKVSLKEFESLNISSVNRALLQVAHRLVELKLGNSKIGNTQVKMLNFQDADSLVKFVKDDLFPSVEGHLLFSVQEDDVDKVEYVEHLGQIVAITNTKEGSKFVSGLRMIDVKSPRLGSMLQIITNSWTEGGYANLTPEKMEEIFGQIDYPVVAYIAKGSSDIYYQNSIAQNST